MIDFDNIKKVEVVTEDAGVEVPTQFKVVDKDGNEALVPADINNVHYRALRDIERAKKKPSVDFDWEDDPEPTPDETIEQDDQGAEPADIALSASQTKAVKLPDVNLTKEQKAEIKAQNQSRQ